MIRTAMSKTYVHASMVSVALALTIGIDAGGLPAGQLIYTTVQGASLQNNLLGYTLDREVAVYLPPSYQEKSEKRYPVLYILHGITDGVRVWTEPWSDNEVEYGAIQNILDRGIASRRLQEMIVVIPDARTPFFGCHYANSPVKGNWRDFIVKDLVGYVDANYRSLPQADSRGLTGHSMGGHGAIRLGLKHPDVFSFVYGMNSSLLGWGGDVSAANPAFEILLTAEDPTQYFQTNFYVPAIIGVSQAFSPNPDNPPFLADIPFKMHEGVLVPNQPAYQAWQANFPVNMLDEYLAAPLRLKRIRFDSAFDDEFTHIPLTSKAFSDALTEKGIPHVFEMYNGDHRNRLWGRWGRLNTEVLPYFSDLLQGDDK